MDDSLNSTFKDEINLRELFITLWAYKFFILFTCALGIVFGGYNALYAVKKYTSTAIFKKDQNQSSNISLGGELSVLANMSGLSGGLNTTALIKEQIFGRIFIETLDTHLNFQTDPYFNTYNPDSIDPTWKSVIKRAVGWEKSSLDTQEIIWQKIVNAYSKSVVLNEASNGSSKIMVTHTDPQRAAEIANMIMNTIISSAKNKKTAALDEQLSYMSDTLAKVLTDLEMSQSNLKEFALENNTLPLESFTVGSFRLDALREQLSGTSELYDAVAALLLLLQNQTIDQKNYLALREQFPIVDQVEFRRVLGQNEIINSWSWPEVSSVEDVLDTLSERKTRLKSKLNKSQLEAERSGLALENYAKLEREATIAEATYTVLIEQVKAQSMAAGYQPDNTEIYEYATASINPSAPKRTLILALGATLGIFLGIVLSLVLALYRGICYSKNSLITLAKAQFTASAKTLLPLRNKNLNEINKILLKKPIPVLRDMAVEIYKSDKTQIIVTSVQAKFTGNDVARAIASYMQSSSMKIAVIDFSSKAKKLDIDNDRLSVGSFVVYESAGNVSVLKPNDNWATMELLSERNFVKNIQSLNSTFDLLFLCADNDDAISLLRAWHDQKTFHITLARTKYTKSGSLAHMSSLLKIQGLLHD